MGLVVAAPHRAAAETIEAALARAYENNPQLNAQRAIVRQDDEAVPQALSGYRPTITANATVGREYTNTKNIIPPTQPILPSGAGFGDRGLTTPYSVGATASQTFFNGERTANSVREAESKVSAARETLRVMEQSVLLAAATVYMDVSRDSANLEVQQNNVRVLQRTLQDTRNRFAAGQITSTDVAQSEAQLAAGESTMHAAESTLMTTRANYRRIIGNEPANLAPASAVDRLAPSTLNAAIVASRRAKSKCAGGLVRGRRCTIAGQDRRRRLVADADRTIQRPATNLFHHHEPQTVHRHRDAEPVGAALPGRRGIFEHPLEQRKPRSAKAQRRSSARSEPRRCRAGLGAIAVDQGADRGRGTPKRCRRPGADRRAQRGDRPANARRRTYSMPSRLWSMRGKI